ncbi:MAG: glycoside hydrolase family 38 C-terminal domain-containing protein, partial [Oscillospiraceae bacterium]|nr:glycoside hydrolase family 38 C-terminal domain-containing protein [Oscillospiraceae bacterium]
EPAKPGVSWLQIQTPYYCLQFKPDGSFASLYDLKLAREWTAGPFNQLRLYQDVPGMYDAWDILPNYKDVAYDWQLSQPLQLEYSNHCLAQFSVTLLTPGGRSSWTMKIRVFRASPFIEVEHQVDWHEKHRLVKADFNCNVLSRELICDTSAGYIRRDCHQNTSWQQARFEVCSHKWCDFAEASGGIALINQGKYGLGVQENGMSLSLLRATVRPDVSSDQGPHNFCYVILPHAGSHLEAGINRQALAYNAPLLAAKLQAPGWDFSPLYLQAVKLSEDGHALVFRLSEQDGQRGCLRLPAALEQMNLLEEVEGQITEHRPFELITLGWPLDQMLV